MEILNMMKETLSGKETKLERWDVLTKQEQVQHMIEASEKRPQLVYKHSHRCSICYLSKNEIEDNFDAIREKADMNFVNVVKNRSVSDALTKQLGVRHESPQVLILRNKESVWDASHHSIKADEILEVLEELK